MRRPLRALPFLAAATLLLAACGSDEPEAADPIVDETPAEEPEAAEPEDESDDATEADQEVDLAVASSSLGAHLVDGRGFTLYVFDDDEPGVSNCTGGCLASWPPATVTADPSWGEGVDGGLVGTLEREDDGSLQLTYDGLPLYLWAADMAPGQATGQGVNEVWWIIAPDGAVITELAPEPEEDDGGSSY